MNLTKFGSVSSQGGETWLSGWTYGKKLTIPESKVDADLINFPLTVYLNNTNFDFTKCKADGSDIRFTDKALNQLKFERKEHTYVVGGISFATYNIQVSSISATTNTEIYMWYGNTSAYNTSIEAWQDQTGKQLTYNGNVKLITGIQTGKRVASFDGTGDYFSLPNNIADFNFLHQVGTTGKWTIEVRCQISNFLASTVLFNSDRDASTNSGIRVYISADRAIHSLILRSTTNTWVAWIDTPAGSYPNDTTGLHNIEISYDQSLTSNNYKILVDGVVVGEATKTAYASSAIACQTPYIGGATIQGYIAGCRITNGKCRNLASPPTTFTIDGADVVFCTNFDTIYDANYSMVSHMGDILIDGSGNGNNGVATGTTVVNTDYGKARSFISGNYITIPNNASLNLPTFSVLTMAKVDTTLSLQNFITKGSAWGESTTNYMLGNHSSMYYFECYAGGIRSSDTQYTSSKYNNEYNVVGMSFLSGAKKSFVEGTLIHTQAMSSTADVNSSVLTFGKISAYPFTGYIGETRISNIARSDAWIKAESLSLKDNLFTIENIAEKLADIEVTVATTSINITGLNLGKGDEVMLVSDMVRTLSSMSYYIYVNNNITSTNYYMQELYANATSVSAGRINAPYLISSEQNQKTIVVTKIKLTNSGYFVWQSDGFTSYSSTTPKIDIVHGTSTFTSTSVTQLAIASTLADGIGVGSRFQLYRIGRKI